jgi:hypothetical protein
MSEKYRLMIYFALGTIHFYRSDISNRDILFKRVSEEAINMFNYELSLHQFEIAYGIYLSDPQSIANTEAYKYPEGELT